MSACVSLHPNSAGLARIVLSYSAQDAADLDLASAYINTAEVIFDLYDKDGDKAVDALDLDYIADSDGVYRGIIPDDIGVVLNKKYRWVITATVAGNSEEFSGDVVSTSNG